VANFATRRPPETVALKRFCSRTTIRNLSVLATRMIRVSAQRSSKSPYMYNIEETYITIVYNLRAHICNDFSHRVRLIIVGVCSPSEGPRDSCSGLGTPALK
jgi:hypothetical protein